MSVLKLSPLPVLAALALASPAAAVTVTVYSDNAASTLIGSLTGGQSYTVTASGDSNLCQTCNGGGSLTFDADGLPTTTPTGSYAGFSPNGLDHDPSAGPNAYGKAGQGMLMGALIGSYSADGSTGYFTLGSSASLTPASNATLYAFVNDTFYGDNAHIGFDVSLNAAGTVPEPASWGLMALGFGLTGTALRRRRVPARAIA